MLPERDRPELISIREDRLCEIIAEEVGNYVRDFAELCGCEAAPHKSEFLSLGSQICALAKGSLAEEES